MFMLKEKTKFVAPKTTNKQKGYAMLEVGLAISVVALAIVAGLALYNSTSTNEKVNESVAHLNDMNNKIVQSYTSDDMTTNIFTTNSVITSGIAPKNLIAAGKVKNPFGGNYEFGSSSGFIGYEVTSSNISKDSCASIVSKMKNSFDTIVVGTTVIQSLSSPSPVAYSKNSVDTACGTLTGLATDTIAFSNKLNQ